LLGDSERSVQEAIRRHERCVCENVLLFLFA
jgi:hypothetical protein